jgi:hypothetical protein
LLRQRPAGHRDRRLNVLGRFGHISHWGDKVPEKWDREPGQGCLSGPTSRPCHFATSKTLAAAVLVTGPVASQQDLPIYLTGLSAVQASFAEGERVVVNSQYKLRQNAKGTETLPTPAVADRARAL